MTAFSKFCMTVYLTLVEWRSKSGVINEVLYQLLSEVDAELNPYLR